MKKFLVPFIATEKLNQSIDEVFNCECDTRFSDKGFLDPSKIMIKPRSGTELLGILPA
jgi:hypothetical protein